MPSDLSSDGKPETDDSGTGEWATLVLTALDALTADELPAHPVTLTTLPPHDIKHLFIISWHQVIDW